MYISGKLLKLLITDGNFSLVISRELMGIGSICKYVKIYQSMDKILYSSFHKFIHIQCFDGGFSFNISRFSRSPLTKSLMAIFSKENSKLKLF